MQTEQLSFTFQKCLGAGGFGEVYLATLHRPGGLDRQVAVKVLRDDLSDTDEAVRRLRDEGRVLTILDHPAILTALELATVEGRVALVTEFVDGVDLSKCCKKGRLLPPRAVIGVIGEVASALHCAWTTLSPETSKPLKLIHRDIKPENIRISKHGAVKLLDFGIARSTEMVRHARTAMGDLPFTPGYAAPEAFTRGFQGSASDVYALGCTMYRLLYGERLYADMKLEEQVGVACLPDRYDPFLAKRLALEVDAPPDALVLIQRMLSYEPDLRPSAFEVQQICERISDELDGLTYQRWARQVNFPEPKEVAGSLTGRTITVDPPDAAAAAKEPSRSRRRRRAAGADTPEGRIPDAPDATPSGTNQFTPAQHTPAQHTPSTRTSGGPPPIPVALATFVPDDATGPNVVPELPHSATAGGARPRTISPTNAATKASQPGVVGASQPGTANPAPPRSGSQGSAKPASGPNSQAPAGPRSVNTLERVASVVPMNERSRGPAKPASSPMWMQVLIGMLVLAFVALLGIAFSIGAMLLLNAFAG